MDVNTALLVAQRHDVAERFAAATLAAHFEQLQDPNDARALASRLEVWPGVQGAVCVKVRLTWRTWLSALSYAWVLSCSV